MSALKPIIEAVSSRAAKKGATIRLSTTETEDGSALVVHKIVVPKESRGGGVGTSVMTDLIEQADKNNIPIALSPSGDFGGNVKRLESFYKRFGFIPNKGRNKDFSLSEKLIRPAAGVSIGAVAATSTFANDDLTGVYMAAREQAATPFDELLGTIPQEQNLPVDNSAESDSGMFKDIALGAIEAPRQIAGGFLDATKELAQSLEGALESAGIPTILQTSDEEGNFDLGLMTKKEFEERGGDPESVYITADEPRTATGGIVRSVSQFLTGFVPAVRGLKAAGVTSKIGQVAGAGALTDAFAFDPQEERLSNLIEEYPALSNPVTDYLESEPDDSDAEGRFKNAIEGLALGGIADTFIKGIKVLRSARIERARLREIESIRQSAEDLAGTTPITREAEAEFIPFEERAAQASPEFSVGAGKAGDEAAANINLNNIESTEQVDNLINRVAEVDAPKINEARREVITLKETEKLADDLGMSVSQLLDRRKGEAFNAEQAVAARKILVSSADNLFALAQRAATGSDEDALLFARAVSQHRAIQAQVSGLTAEAGRALSSFRINAKTSEGQVRAINEALEAGGGIENLRDLAADLSRLDNVTQLNTLVRLGGDGIFTKGRQMAYEYWINALLSSPATHAVNVLSNSIVAGWSVGERLVASAISSGFGDDAIGSGEFVGNLFGIVQGGKDGFKLAWHALKTGDPSDPLQKVEQQQFKRITAENVGLTGVAGRAADFLGETVRMPGRFLMAGDELFKAMGYRMELNAQAFRTAKGEGLSGDAMAARMQDIISNPPENIHLAAVDASRYQTFTKELGERGKSIQRAISKNPEARIIVPFLRTPTNIIKWVGERTPLAPLNASIREEIAAGGARRDMALAKISTGSLAMAISADYAISGDITGGGPKNPQMRAALLATGWQPYSIKVGDNYYSYQRLDPAGAFIGLSADIVEIMGQTNEADTMNLAMSAVTATAQNITSKTYLSSLAEFFDMMSGISADPESANTQARRWTERLAGSVVPAGVAQIERTLSPELNATYGILEKIKSRIPGYSDDLPPRRNIFGEPIVLSGGLGPDIMSPIYTSEYKHDPVADEIVKQKTLLRMPLRNIGGVELSTQQYDDYILFYSGKDNPAVKFQPLKERLQEEMQADRYVNASDGPEGMKSEIIRTIFSIYQESAKREMLNKYPEIQNEINRKKVEQIEKKRGL
jgi:hypothetical protein